MTPIQPTIPNRQRKLKSNRQHRRLLLRAGMMALFNSKIATKAKTVKLFGTDKGVFFKNGRSAIRCLLDELNAHGYTSVVIPERICNVVSKSAEAASLRIVTYKDIVQLGDVLKKEDSRIILIIARTASVNQWLPIEQVRRLAAESTADVFLLFDECQNLTRTSIQTHAKMHSNEAVVYSFNDKMVPGVFGAFLCTGSLEIPASQVQSLKFHQEMRYIGIYLKNLIDTFRPTKMRNNLKGEYSICDSFQYDLTPGDISRISVAVAFVYMDRLAVVEDYRNKQADAISRKLGRKLKSNHIFLPVSESEFSIFQDHFSFKGPYLKTDGESVGSALSDGGNIAIHNSFRFQIDE